MANVIRHRLGYLQVCNRVHDYTMRERCSSNSERVRKSNIERRRKALHSYWCQIVSRTLCLREKGMVQGARITRTGYVQRDEEGVEALA